MYYSDIGNCLNDNNREVINFNNIILSEIVNRTFEENSELINFSQKEKVENHSRKKIREHYFYFLKENEENIRKTQKFKEIEKELKSKYKKELESWSRVKDNSVNFFYRKKIHIKLVKTISDITTVFSEIGLRIEDRIRNELKKERVNTSIDIIGAINSELKSKFYFRGQESIDFQSIPSLFRDNIYYENEHNLYEKIQIGCPQYFKDKNRHIDKLAEMQHYGLPTRLLDLTTNLLVALFFAVSGTEETLKFDDGEVVPFYVNESNQKSFNSDIIEIISSYSFLTQQRKEDVQKVVFDYIGPTHENLKNNNFEEWIKRFNEEDAIKRLLHEAEKSGFNFNPVLNPRDLFGIYFVSPLQNSLRLARQSGSFIISGLLCEKDEYSFENNKSNYSKSINEFVYRNGNNQVVKFVIPYEYKKSILSELSVMGMNKGTVYPEIDRVSDYLKESIGIKELGDKVNLFGLKIDL